MKSCWQRRIVSLTVCCELFVCSEHAAHNFASPGKGYALHGPTRLPSGGLSTLSRSFPRVSASHHNVLDVSQHAGRICLAAARARELEDGDEAVLPLRLRQLAEHHGRVSSFDSLLSTFLHTAAGKALTGGLKRRGTHPPSDRCPRSPEPVLPFEKSGVRLFPRSPKLWISRRLATERESTPGSTVSPWHFHKALRGIRARDPVGERKATRVCAYSHKKN